MQAVASSKILVSIYKITWHHNPEDHNPQFHSCKNLQTYIMQDLIQQKL
jgi:hypothetical protein